MNKVSVIVPVYNAQNFLEKCIESVITDFGEISEAFSKKSDGLF